MATSDADLWHQVHAQREDGVAARFLIREVEPRDDQPQIFMIELPYPITDPSKLPDDASYRRLETFQEQWIEPACEALGWTLVAWKSEDGSFFFYLYGNGDPNALLEKLTPFDGALGFFHDRDAEWSEYAALRELVEQAEAAEEDAGEGDHVHTDDCEHDHDPEATSQAISVVDLTGERPAGKATAKQPATAKRAKPSASTRAAKSTKAASRPKAKAKPAKAASRPKAKAASRPKAKAKPVKAASRPKAKAKPTTKPAKPSAIRKVAHRSGSRRAATSKPAARRSASPAAPRKQSKSRAPRR